MLVGFPFGHPIIDEFSELLFIFFNINIVFFTRAVSATAIAICH
jgi:hypothetical protein